MSAPEPFVPLDSIRSVSLRRDLDRIARELLDTKQEIKGYVDPLLEPIREILDDLEKKKETLQRQLNDTGTKLTKVKPQYSRVLSDSWKVYYRRGRVELSESRLLERGVDIEDIKASRVEKGGTYIVAPVESEEGE